MNRRNIIMSVAVLAISMAIFMPLRVIFGGDGVTARKVDGIIWDGSVRDLRLGKLPVGDVNTRLRFWPLFLGRAELLLSRGNAPFAPGMSGSISRGIGGVSINDLTATLPTHPMRPNGMPGMGMGRGMRGMFVQPREDGTGFDMIIPFTLAEGTALTADAQAAITGLGWTVQPKDGEDGMYELIIPAESVRDGLNLAF